MGEGEWQGERVVDRVDVVETVKEGEGEVLELALGLEEMLRVTVTLCEMEGQEDTVKLNDDVGEVEGDLLEVGETEIETVFDRVLVPLEEVLGHALPEKVTEGERDKEGELDSVADKEDVGDWDEDRVGEGVPDMEMLVERVRVPVGEMLGEKVTERVMDVDRVWEGEAE